MSVYHNVPEFYITCVPKKLVPSVPSFNLNNIFICSCHLKLLEISINSTRYTYQALFLVVCIGSYTWESGQSESVGTVASGVSTVPPMMTDE